MTMPLETPTWCTSCQRHRATLGRPVCPVCLDQQAKEKAGKP